MNDLYTYSQKTQGLPVEIIELPNGQTGIRLTADILYQHTPIGPVLVPRGFVSDGASMPRIAWRALGHPFDYDYLYEAILHDYLYRYQDVDRATADRVLYIMLKGKISGARRRAIYWGLRIGGGVAWRENAKRAEKKPETPSEDDGNYHVYEGRWEHDKNSQGKG